LDTRLDTNERIWVLRCGRYKLSAVRPIVGYKRL
jgi:hypothetical protein